MNKYTTIRVDTWIADELRAKVIGNDTLASVITSLLIDYKQQTEYDEASTIWVANGWAKIGDEIVAVKGQSGKYRLVGIEENALGIKGMRLEPVDKFTKALVCDTNSYAVWRTK